MDRLAGFFSRFWFTNYTLNTHDLPAKIQTDAMGHPQGLLDAWLEEGLKPLS